MEVKPASISDAMRYEVGAELFEKRSDDPRCKILSCSGIREKHVFKGTVATGDQFIANSEYEGELQRDYDAYACEMEGAAAAVVCIKYETPFVMIRALSDKADGNAHDSYENFGDIAADNSSQIVIKMLDSIEK